MALVTYIGKMVVWAERGRRQRSIHVSSVYKKLKKLLLKSMWLVEVQEDRYDRTGEGTSN